MLEFSQYTEYVTEGPVVHPVALEQHDLGNPLTLAALAEGARVTHAGQTWRSLIPDNTTEPGSDPRWWECEDCETTTEWAVGVAYKGDNTEGAWNGDIVTYQGAEYRCLQSHTSQAGWTPSAVPALWEAV